MQDFDKYINDICDYIEERMNVVTRYDDKYNTLYITFNVSDENRMCIYDVIGKFYGTWRNTAVGAVAQELMRNIKDEWVSLLMRKENV